MKPFLLIVLLAVLALLALRAAREGGDAIEAVEVVRYTPAVEASGDVSDTGTVEIEAPSETVDEAEEATQGAKRIVKVPSEAPGNFAPDFNSWSVAYEHLEAYSKHNLELALANDLEAAARIDGVHYRCRDAPRSEEDIERSVENTMLAYRLSQEQSPGFRARSESEVMKKALERYRGCQFWEELFNDEMRSMLERLANNGHVIARYMYAMWPPRIAGQPDGFLVQQDWAQKALDFSLANLAEGELAGLLVFVHAYGGDTRFTARDSDLGNAFLVVAVECGLNIPRYSQLLDQLLNPKDTEPVPWEPEDPRPRILAMAEGLKGFCR